MEQVLIYKYLIQIPKHLCVNVLSIELKKKIEYIPKRTFKTNVEHRRELVIPHAMSFILLQDKIKNTNIWDSLPYRLCYTRVYER